MIDGFEIRCSFLNELAFSKILKKYDKVKIWFEV
jgi:hypothetical protein